MNCFRVTLSNLCLIGNMLPCFHSILFLRTKGFLCAQIFWSCPSEVIHILLGCVRKGTDHAVNCYKNIYEINKRVVEEGFLFERNFILTTLHKAKTKQPLSLLRNTPVWHRNLRIPNFGYNLTNFELINSGERAYRRRERHAIYLINF